MDDKPAIKGHFAPKPEPVGAEIPLTFADVKPILRRQKAALVPIRLFLRRDVHERILKVCNAHNIKEPLKAMEFWITAGLGVLEKRAST